MSQENVEVVRRLFDAAQLGNYGDPIVELHPDAEWHNTAVFPGPKVVHGATAISRFLQDMFEAYGDPAESAMKIEKVADAEDVVVVLVHGSTRGRTSGVPVDTRWAQTFRLQDAKVVRVEVHGRYDKALEAVGLAE